MCDDNVDVNTGNDNSPDKESLEASLNRKLEARRKLEDLKERKALREKLGDDWDDSLLDDDL